MESKLNSFFKHQRVLLVKASIINQGNEETIMA